jgi:hypothetical protein
MSKCEHRERLTIQYNDAVVTFAAAVNHLKECNGSGNGFAEAQRAAELARLHAENARLMLEMHRAEHNC